MSDYEDRPMPSDRQRDFSEPVNPNQFRPTPLANHDTVMADVLRFERMRDEAERRRKEEQK